MRTSAQQQSWEDMAALDPYWAILSVDEKQFGGWSSDEFFAEGRTEVDALLAEIDELGLPRQRTRALDYGCGLGRVTRALAPHFSDCVGLDISREMVAGATRLNADVPGLRFVASGDQPLASFDDGAFDLVYTRLVLHHIPDRATVKRTLAEFIRLLSPGGLAVAQLMTHIPLRHRIQPRPRLYSLLRRAGVPAEALYRRLGLRPIRMSFVPEREVVGELQRAGAEVLRVDSVSTAGGRSSTFYATRPARGTPSRTSPSGVGPA